MIEKFIKYFSVISIGVFILSYAYLDGYYSVFNISIVNYITTSEIFYALLPLVIAIISSATGLFQGYNSERPKKSIGGPGEKPIALFEKIWFIIFFPYFISLIGAGGLFVNFLKFPYRDAPAVSTLCVALFIGGITYATMRREIREYGFTFFGQLVCFVFVGYLFFDYGQVSAKTNIALGSKVNIEFKYHSKLYSTGTKVIFVGETQSTIFIFNKSDSSTLILPRSNVDSLVILNSSRIARK
jgi:hypothetical protein